MNRRNSVLDHKDQAQPPTNATPAQQLTVTSFEQSVTTSAAEAYDATAAALSRLTVMTDGRTTGTASPALNTESTYETSVLSPCPSPSKRGSEYFDMPLVESNLKRLRREGIQTSPSYVELSAAEFTNSPMSPASISDSQSFTGLGITSATPSPTIAHSQVLTWSCRSPVTERASDCFQQIFPSPIKEAQTTSRQRSKSAPPLASTSNWVNELEKRTAVVHSCSNSPRVDSKASRQPRVKLLTQIPTPPITQHTLRELELSEIFKNAQLRHDIVHDPNLQFRPNTDGERGAKKRHESNRYWRSIVQELDSIQTWNRNQLGHNCLAIMFQEMKNVLLSLVPASEKGQVEGSFDHELFLQTLHHGLFSPSAFASYISSILKRHCAPMRDEAIDRTVAKIQNATASVDFAESLRATFDILEMMKLDVANHQLRTLRGYLLDTSVEFERNWFNRKFDSMVYSRDSVKEWYLALPHKETNGHLDHKLTFVGGFIELFKSVSRKPSVPASFIFDQTRIAGLAKDIRELSNLCLVVLLAKQLIKGLSAEELPALKAEIWAVLAMEKSSGCTRWHSCIPDIALHLVQRANLRKQPLSRGVPMQADIKFAESWLTTNQAVGSTLHTMIQTRLMKLLGTLVYNELTATVMNGHKTDVPVDWGMLSMCQPEVQNVALRMAAIADYHWKVQGTSYTTWFANEHFA